MLFHLHNIRRIRKYLSVDTPRTLVHAFIMDRIDYCNSLSLVLPGNSVCKLQRVQKAATRLVTGFSRFQHITCTPVLYNLHWLPVRERIIFQMCILAFRAIHGLAPTYLTSLVSVKRSSMYSLRSEKSEVLIESTCNQCKIN